MFFNHPVSDLVARIKNGYMVNKIKVSSPVSKLRENILFILKSEGYILNYSKIQNGPKSHFDIQLKYHNSSPVISEIQVISKPGKRVYCSADNVPLVKNGLGLVVVSTPEGVLADHEARSKKVGGEVLLKVF